MRMNVCEAQCLAHGELHEECKSNSSWVQHLGHSTHHHSDQAPFTLMTSHLKWTLRAVHLPHTTFLACSLACPPGWLFHIISSLYKPPLLPSSAFLSVDDLIKKTEAIRRGSPTHIPHPPASFPPVPVLSLHFCTGSCLLTSLDPHLLKVVTLALSCITVPPCTGHSHDHKNML